MTTLVSQGHQTDVFLGNVTFDKTPSQLNHALNAYNNFLATRAPTVSDDFNLGYDVGSLWIFTDTSGFSIQYVCMDSTVDAAVWESTTIDSRLASVPNVKQNLVAVLPPTVNDDSSQGYATGSRWITSGYPTLGRDEWICVDPSEGVAVWKKTSAYDPQGYLVNLNAHIGDSSIHFHKSEVAHTDLFDISGTLTHAQIDAQLLAMTAHIDDVSGNPHQVTAAQIGLGNVPNAGLVLSSQPPSVNDAENYNIGMRWIDGSGDEWLLTQLYDVSGTPQANWYNMTAAGFHATDFNNPHELTATQVGLGNVPNVPQYFRASGFGPNGVDSSFSQTTTGTVYPVGSRWVDQIATHEWVCENYNSGTTVATWNQTTSQDATGFQDELNAHVNDLSIHFHVNEIAHTDLSDIGTGVYKTHQVIDAHIADISGNPHKITKTTIGLPVVANILNNYGQSGNSTPTIAANGAAGYSIGSRWTTTNGRDFVCINNGGVTGTGNAVWVETTNEGNGITNNYQSNRDPTLTDDGSLGYSAGSIWINNGSNVYYVCIKNTTGNALWQPLTGTANLKNSRVAYYPSSTDDASQGYSVGSRWASTFTGGRAEFVCLDTTVGRAIWKMTTAPVDPAPSSRVFIWTTSPTASHDVSGAYLVGDMWINTTDSSVWFLAVNTINQALWIPLKNTNSLTGSTLTVAGNSTTTNLVTYQLATLNNGVEVGGVATFYGIVSVEGFNLDLSSFALGAGATTGQMDYDVVIGNTAAADAHDVIVIGHSAAGDSTGTKKIGLGDSVFAGELNTIAIGSNSVALTSSGISLGGANNNTYNASFMCPQFYTDITDGLNNWEILTVDSSGTVGRSSSVIATDVTTDQFHVTNLSNSSQTLELQTTTHLGSFTGGAATFQDTVMNNFTTLTNVTDLSHTHSMTWNPLGSTVPGFFGILLFSNALGNTTDEVILENATQTMFSDTMSGTIWSGDVLTIAKTSDPTAMLLFDIDNGVASGNTVTLQPPSGVSGTKVLADTASSQTWTSKTMSGLTGTNTTTLITSGGQKVRMVNGMTVAIGQPTSLGRGTASSVSFYQPSISSSMTIDMEGETAGSHAIILDPGVSGAVSDTMVLQNAANTGVYAIANKTWTTGNLISDAVQVFSSTSPTSALKFSLSGITAGNTVTLTLPATTTATAYLVDLSGAQTLSNKTLPSLTYTGLSTPSGHTLTMNATTNITATTTFATSVTVKNTADLDVSGTAKATTLRLKVGDTATLQNWTVPSNASLEFNGEMGVNSQMSGLAHFSDSVASDTDVVMSTDATPIVSSVSRTKVHRFSSSSSSYVIPSGVKMLHIVMYGGGGGGAVINSSTLGGGGGGGGARVAVTVDVTSYNGSTVTVTIGSGGTGGTAPTGNGGNGGDTIVQIGSGGSAQTFTAYGGIGGSTTGTGGPGGGSAGSGTLSSGLGGPPALGVGLVGVSGGGAGSNLAGGNNVRGLYAESGGASGSGSGGTSAFKYGGSSILGGGGGGGANVIVGGNAGGNSGSVSLTSTTTPLSGNSIHGGGGGAGSLSQTATPLSPYSGALGGGGGGGVNNNQGSDPSTSFNGGAGGAGLVYIFEM